MGKVIDLTGQRFGRLTVIERGESHRTAGGQVKTVWSCQCDCGSTALVQAASLRRRRTVSCGCHRKTQAIGGHDAEVLGLRSGRLVAVRRVGEKHGCALWECQCDCGETTVVRSTSLRSQTTKSCGCLSRETSSVLADEVGYLGAHDRVRQMHGAASDRLCVDCGSRAEEWSYIGGDRAERIESRGRCKGFAYSLSPAYYAPRCRPCHRSHDARARGDAS